MSISSARLLAHLCCISLLLLSLICITSANPTKTTPATSSKGNLENKSSNLDLLSGKKDKCQYNLTGSNQFLEAKSSIYQQFGFSQCEYIIEAPSSRFLLLNFTDIHSQSDMPVETTVQHNFQQAAGSETTTSIPESILATTTTQLRKPPSHEKVNSTALHSDRGKLVSTTANKIGDTYSSPNNLHINSRHITSQPHSGIYSNSLHGKLGKNKNVSTDDNHFISKDSIGSSNKILETSPSTVDDNDFKLSTASDGSHVGIHSDVRVPNCCLKIIIEDINSSSGSKPQVICWEKSWQHRIPLVFQYSVPIRITYVWDRHSQSGFSLDFRFLRPEAEVDCLFRCNNYLCLPKKQLCDGYFDCPDQSDEHSSTCALAGQQQESGEPHVINVIVIVISVILGIIIVLALIFMISHIRCRNGACRGGDSLLQPPHCQSSEVCRTASSSMQESGQYEALLHQHPQSHTATVPGLMVAGSWCSEHQQLLHQQHHEPEVEQQQQRNHRTNRNHQMSQLHQLCLLNAETNTAVSPDTSSGLLQHRHQQPTTDQQHILQQRKHKQAHKQISPDELYPPNIPLSADGEEGYAMSQKALRSKHQLEQNWQVENEVFRPPPNKTVYDRDSPPPPYSINPPGTQTLDSQFSSIGVDCILRQARSSLTPQGTPPRVSQCHSLSCHH